MAYLAHHAYSTAFKRHISFFDRNRDGFIYLGESLRGNLALGLDFPVAFAMAVGYQTLYGNTRPFFFGPFRGIEIQRLRVERNMIQGVDLDSIARDGLDRSQLVSQSGAVSLMDKLHVYGLWALTANTHGKLAKQDVQKIQEGTMLYSLEQRRRDRSDVLPLLRGGPISVAGHSWFVDKLFGVKVYQTDALKRE